MMRQFLNENPKDVWQFCYDLVELAAKFKPSPVHIAIAKFQALKEVSTTLVTQTLDDFHG